MLNLLGITLRCHGPSNGPTVISCLLLSCKVCTTARLDVTVWVRRITARLRTLPLVSTRWARIMRTSTEVWQTACLDLAEIAALSSDPQLVRLDPASMAVWFLARPGRFRELGLQSTDRDLQMQPVMTGVLLSSQAASLRSLSIDPAAYGLRAPELKIIAALQGLTALHVHVVENGLADRGAAVIRAASRLPALSQLDVIYEPVQGITMVRQRCRLPRCQELDRLRSDSLTHLTIDLASGTMEDALFLAGVPNLRQCRLFTPPSTTTFYIFASSLDSCTRMEELTLQGQRSLSLGPGCFSALAALTSLTLADCGLSAVPLAIAPLTSLYSLDLSQNEFLHVDDSGASVLRTLKGLRALDVAKQEPAVHRATSVQALVDLIEIFRDEGLPLHVNFDVEKATYLAEHTFWGFVEGS